MYEVLEAKIEHLWKETLLETIESEFQGLSYKVHLYQRFLREDKYLYIAADRNLALNRLSYLKNKLIQTMYIIEYMTSGLVNGDTELSCVELLKEYMRLNLYIHDFSRQKINRFNTVNNFANAIKRKIDENET